MKPAYVLPSFLEWIPKAVNLSNGDIWQTPSGKEKTYGLEYIGRDVSLTISDFNASKKYYTYSFIWTPKSVRFTILNENGNEIELWQYCEQEHIPTRQAKLLFNVWHTNNWSPEDDPDAETNPPSNDAVLRVDWVEYESPIYKGLQYLRTTQQGTPDPSDGDGSWSSDVGVTSLAALCFMNAGYDETDPDVRDAIGYIHSKVQGDGSIWSSSYSKTSHTSLATLALVATHNDSYDAKIDNAAQWLKTSQWDGDCLWGTVSEDNWYYGGFGYGYHIRPDNSNTQFALMALDAVQSISKDDPLWDKAQVFLNGVQARDESNDQPWANGRNSGGFIYTGDGGTAGSGSINGYGSMTGAGIWGLRLSNAKKDDSRVEAAVGWVTNNYMWDGNPGMSSIGAGQYYYYLSMSKALTMIGDSIGGHDWYQDLSNNLTALQKPDGYWVNDRSNWAYEDNKDLVTSYAILSLQTRGDIPEGIQRLSWLTVEFGMKVGH